MQMMKKGRTGCPKARPPKTRPAGSTPLAALMSLTRRLLRARRRLRRRARGVGKQTRSSREAGPWLRAIGRYGHNEDAGGVEVRVPGGVGLPGRRSEDVGASSAPP